MILTTIYRVFIPWEEYDFMVAFEKENKDFHKVSEDTTGVTYESRTDKFRNVGKGKKNDNR